MSIPSHTWVHLLLILVPQTLIMAADLDCTYNTRGVLFCSWKADHQYTTAPCNVTAKAKDKRDISGSCTLSHSEIQRQCAIRLTYNGKYRDDPLTVGHEVNMSVICSIAQTKKIATNISKFSPYDNVRLDSPEYLNIKMTEGGKWNLTWSVIANRILIVETEVHYKPLEASWQDAQKITLRENELSIVLRGLVSNSLYEAKVRVTTKNDIKFQPGARWSSWSQPIVWRTAPEESSGSADGTQFKPLIVSMVAVAVFLVILIIFNHKRVKKIIWIGVPNPSSFFDPLMSDHKGNFQKWLSSPFPFASFYPDQCPPDISPLDVNWNKEEHHTKSQFDQTQEVQNEKNIHCGSSVSNKSYFAPSFLTYDHVDHQSFQTVASHESLPSPNEEMPLFHADYLCAPLSIASLGFHNKSFELGSPKRNMHLPMLVEEIMHNAQNHEECSSTLPLAEEVTEKEENEDLIESPGACSTTALVFAEVQPASCGSDDSTGYFSLHELHQKHAVHWK